MDLGKLSYYSRKIHRISLWFVTISGLIQMITGVIQKYPGAFSSLDFSMIISIHTTNSTIFTLFFLISMITGLIMYVTPILVKRLAKSPPPPPLSN